METECDSKNSSIETTKMKVTTSKKKYQLYKNKTMKRKTDLKIVIDFGIITTKIISVVT